MKGRYPLSSTIEHAVETLGPDFEFEDERRFTLSVSTSFLPADCLDALGIPEAQPLKLHFRFSGSHICADLLPSVEVTYCEHGRTRQMHQQNRPAQATPHDKFLHQVKHIVHKHMRATWPPPDAKAAQCILNSTHAYITQRLATLSSFCVVCDAQQPSPGPKPVPCDDPKCAFAYDELGLGSGLSELYQAPAVADLLISMATAAIRCPAHKRRPKLFATVPGAFVTERATLDKPPELNWAHLEQSLAKLPPVQTMANSPDLRSLLTEEFNLVRWILSTNRSYLAPLEEHEMIVEMQTPHQYRLVLSSTSHAASFAAAKAQEGSFYAFHGSAFYNWHSILRSTLRNFSNTDMMSAGAAYGAGIYLAPSSGTSAAYAQAASGWEGSMFGSTARCIALCEVINGAASNNANAASYAIVVPDESLVITRYLFVYDCHTTLPTQLSAATLKQKCDAASKDVPWHAIPMQAPPATHTKQADRSKSSSPEHAHTPPPSPPAKRLLSFITTRSSSKRMQQADAQSHTHSTSGRLSGKASRSTEVETPAFQRYEHSDDAMRCNASDDNDSAHVGDDDDSAQGGDDDDSEVYFDDDDEDDDGMDFAEDSSQPHANRAVGADESDRQLGVAGGAARTLVKELRNLSKMDTRAEGFEAAPLDDSDMLLWEAKLFLTEGSLATELQTYAKLHGQGYMKLRLSFPADYPISPPFVWLVSPRLEFRTGFVSRGAICTTMLVNSGTSAGWSASYTIDKVLMVIRSNFQDHDARGKIDNMRVYREYSEEEARGGFVHAKTLHGW